MQDKSMNTSASPSIPPGASAPQISTLRYDLATSLTPEEEEQMLIDMDSSTMDHASLDSDDDFPSDMESTDVHDMTKQFDESPPYYDPFQDENGEGGTNDGFERPSPPSHESLDWESAQPVKTDGPLIQKTPAPSPVNPTSESFRPTSPSQNPRASGSRSSASMAAMVRSGPLCVICGKRPAYNDGRRAYNTCSKTCGAQLKALQGLPNQSGSSRSIGQGYDLRSGTSSMWDNYQTSSMVNLHQRATPTTVRMCVVCHTRRQCVRGGVVYPTCGLTCASKLAGSQGIEMCTFCHQRPKAIRNGKTYPQCGKTCRDKAQAAATNVAACATCVLCWKRFKAGNSDFCSEECVANAERRSPVLLEIPKGHVSFKKVADCFSRAWKDTRMPSPTVKRIYMVSIKKSAKNNYELYRNKVGQHGSFQKKGNELLSWLGIARDCGFGDPGKTEPCASPKCLMCCIVKSNVTRIEYPNGIMSTPLPRAVEMVGTPARRSSKVVLLANILMGRQIEMDSRHVTEYTPPPGIDSIRLVSITPVRKIEYGEVVVYHGDAVKPLYLITYE